MAGVQTAAWKQEGVECRTWPWKVTLALIQCPMDVLEAPSVPQINKAGKIVSQTSMEPHCPSFMMQWSPRAGMRLDSKGFCLCSMNADMSKCIRPLLSRPRPKSGRLTKAWRIMQFKLDERVMVVKKYHRQWQKSKTKVKQRLPHLPMQ